MEQRQKMLLFKLLLSLLLLLLLLLLLSSFVKTADPSGIPQQAFPPIFEKGQTSWRGNEVLDKLFLIVVEAIDFLNFELCMAVSWV